MLLVKAFILNCISNERLKIIRYILFYDNFIQSMLWNCDGKLGRTKPDFAMRNGYLRNVVFAALPTGHNLKTYPSR